MATLPSFPLGHVQGREKLSARDLGGTFLAPDVVTVGGAASAPVI